MIDLTAQTEEEMEAIRQAVVEKEGGGHALVPESYLELIEAD